MINLPLSLEKFCGDGNIWQSLISASKEIDLSEPSLIFPEGFRFGVATSAYQIEGAVTEDGRGRSIWDDFGSLPGKVKSGHTGDIACDHYHRFAEDIRIMKDLGVEHYRFSVAWPRIFPQGHGKPNQAGLDFYSRLVDDLLKAGIEPYLTLYHWDLPSALQKEEGWLNRDTAQYFADYSQTLASTLGDRVKYWTTINEPWVVAKLGFKTGEMAPGIVDEKKSFQAAHNLLLGHGLAVERLRAMDTNLKLGIVQFVSPAYPATDDPECRKAAEEHWKLNSAWFVEPVLTGGYPEVEKSYLDMVEPVIKEGDMKLISQKLDYLGINYYFRDLVSTDGVIKNVPGANFTVMNWEIYPQGLKDVLVKLNNDYDLPQVYITENGAAFEDDLQDGQVGDNDRIDFIREHLTSLREAMDAGVDVQGYFLWSLLDNFEWAYGYTKRFGIVHVDFTTQKRTLKQSAHWYSKLIGSHKLSKSFKS